MKNSNPDTSGSSPQEGKAAEPPAHPAETPSSSEPTSPSDSPAEGHPAQAIQLTDSPASAASHGESGQPVGSEDSPKAGHKRGNPILEGLIYLIAGIVMLIWEPAKALRRKVYVSDRGSGLLSLLGVILGLGAGIATGYSLGWDHSANLWKWLPAGVLAAVVTYVYAWPVLYLAAIKPTDQLSRALWTRVIGRGRPQSWVTRTLMFLGKTGIICGSLYGIWSIMLKLHTELSMGDFGYLVGFLCGVLVCGVAVATAWLLLWLAGVRLFALAFSVGLTFLSHPWITSLVWQTALPAGAGNAVLGVAYLLEFYIYSGLVFPAAHIALTDGLGWLFDKLEQLRKQAYSEQAGGYRDSHLQLANLLSVWLLSSFAYHQSVLSGLSPVSGAGISALVALLTYVIAGKALMSDGNSLVGGLTGIYLALFSGLGYFSTSSWLGIPAAIAVAASVYVVTYYAAYPLWYVAVRYVLGPVLSGRVRSTLVGAHERVCEAVDKLLEKLHHAYEDAYGDTTPFRELFLHLVNLGAVVSVCFGSVAASHALGFGPWLTAAGMVLDAVISYLLVGKLLLWAGNKLPGTLASVAVGVLSGALVYGTHHHGIGASILTGLVSVILTFEWLFPMLYVILQWLSHLVRANAWLRPLLTGLFGWVSSMLGAIWEKFRSAYRSMRARFEPVWQNLAQTWHDSWVSLRDRISRRKP